MLKIEELLNECKRVEKNRCLNFSFSFGLLDGAEKELAIIKNKFNEKQPQEEICSDNACDYCDNKGKQKCEVICTPCCFQGRKLSQEEKG